MLSLVLRGAYNLQSIKESALASLASYGNHVNLYEKTERLKLSVMLTYGSVPSRAVPLRCGIPITCNYPNSVKFAKLR